MASDRESTEISLCGGWRSWRFEGTIPYLYFNTLLLPWTITVSHDSRLICSLEREIYIHSPLPALPTHTLSEGHNKVSIYISVDIGDDKTEILVRWLVTI